jgi:integrase
MPSKRADGEGTLVKRKDKTGKVIGYKGAVTVGYTKDGTPDRRWVSGKTEAATRLKIEALKTARNNGSVSSSQRLTLGEYLERWIAYKEEDGTRLKTVSGYRYVVSHRLIPILGKTKLEKLRALDVEHAVKVIRDSVSTKEARRARTFLSMALNQAVRWQIIPRNVCQHVRPPVLPASEQKEIRFWTPEEAAKFLEVARPHRLYAFFYLGLLTGMRPCELLGLRWQDIDFAGDTLNVRQDAVDVRGKMHIGPCKTNASRRTITISPDVLTVLRSHQAQQAQECDNAQEGYTNLDLVFASEVGTVTQYRNLRRVLETLITLTVMRDWKAKGLIESSEPTTPERYKELLLEHQDLQAQVCVGGIGVHGLRHTHASILIRRGVNAKVVSDRLGHTSVAFTLKTYAHLFDVQKREAAIGIEAFLGSSYIAPSVPVALPN